jgi:hypothetical protein
LTTTPAPFDDLDLNKQDHRERIYYDRVRAEFEGVSDEDVIAQAKQEVPYFRDDAHRWQAIYSIAEHRVKVARQVEPPMETFRKVRAGWYTIPIISFDEAFKTIHGPSHERKFEEHVDVSADKDTKGWWIVSIRGGRDGQDTALTLNQRSLFRESFHNLAQAKRYAVALKAYLQDKCANPDWLRSVFSAEDDAKHRAHIEAVTGEPYDEWMTRMTGRAS